jgi:tetratricopeptide (TPR) repeat protein
MQNTDKLYLQIEHSVLNNELQAAFEMLGGRAAEIGNVPLKEEVDSQKRIYRQMLDFTFRNAEDPQRAEILKKIKIKVLAVNDELRELVIRSNPASVLGNAKENFWKFALTNQLSIEQMLQDLGKLDFSERTETFRQLFNLIWFTDKLSENEANQLRKLIRSKSVEFFEKSLIVSALTLSLLRYFGLNKFTLLFDAYDTNDQFIWNRAFVGLIIGFYVYNRRLVLYKDPTDRLKVISDDKGIENYLKLVIFQLIRTRETEKISEKLRNEIIPEMSKFRPQIEDKLDLDKILSDKLIEDENPDWERIFEDSSDLLGKMEEMSQMQLEGSDVFMSAFSQLKHFDFFNSSANWFLPFYKDNPEIRTVFSSETEDFDVDLFTEGLQSSSYICNSDKYSFCLNIEMMPSGQKSMILSLFKMEMDAMADISKEDKILDADTEDKHIFTRYIQDIYRFYKLSRYKNDLYDFFNTKLDIQNTVLFEILSQKPDTLRHIAEFYLQKAYYGEAAETFLLLDDEEKSKGKTYEKIAFAYQKMKAYKKALKYYKRAELFSAESGWLNKKLGFCSRKIGDYENALFYYEKAEEQQPENLHIIANKGHCYLSAERYEEALQTYFKVEYFDPDNIRVKRPLAWCSFVLGKYDSAEKYLNILLQAKASPHDNINLGHVLFCQNKKAEAAEQYAQAVHKTNYEKVKASILDDKEQLLNNGVSETELYLLLDYLLMRDN